MLRKLMKYEWKSIWRVTIVINIFTLLATLMGFITIHVIGDKDVSSSLEFVNMLIFIFYYTTIISVSFAMSIYIAVRFYRSFYTDEGYLTHTLPVTARQLVLSRLLIHSLCFLLTEMLIALSIISVLLPLFAQILDDSSISLSHFMEMLSVECQTNLHISPLLFYLCIIVGCIISTVSGVLSIYCAIVFGQNFQKHRIMGSILCYIVIYYILQTINSILIMPQTFKQVAGGSFNSILYVYNLFLTTSLISLAVGIIFYIIILHMMNKKLNLI